MNQIDEKSVCEIVQDLLPLYLDGGCTPGTARTVEEHVQTCDGCRDLLRAMSAPLEEVCPKQPLTLEEPIEAHQALKKVRRRVWSVICAGVLLVLLVAGVVSAVQFLSSYGLRPGNREDYQAMEQALAAWQEEGAMGFLDQLEPTLSYEELSQDQSLTNRFSQWLADPSDYTSVRVGGRTYWLPSSFLTSSTYTEEEEDLLAALEAGDEVAFLRSAMLAWDQCIIPERVFAAARGSYLQLLNYDYQSVTLEGGDYEIRTTAESLVRRYLFEEDLETYLTQECGYDPASLAEVETFWDIVSYWGLSLMPEELYQSYRTLYQQIYDYYNQDALYYRTAGYQVFYAAWYSAMQEAMSSFDEMGYSLTDYSYREISRVSEDVWEARWLVTFGSGRLANLTMRSANGKCTVNSIQFFNSPWELSDALVTLTQWNP